MADDSVPPGGPTRDMAFYERLISRGVAEADTRGSAIDHVTARRLAIWLLPRSQQEPEFMRGLVHFARTGGITDPLRKQLRRQARSPSHPSSPHAARLLQYAVARGADTGRIGDHFGAVCDQIDHADALLEDLHERVIQNRLHPELATGDWRERFTLKPAAMARRDNVTRAVTFILDSTAAEAAVNAITRDTARSVKLASARPGNKPRHSPKAPTAGRTARPSSPAKQPSSKACAPSNAPTTQPSNQPQPPSSVGYCGQTVRRPTTSCNWNDHAVGDHKALDRDASPSPSRGDNAPRPGARIDRQREAGRSGIGDHASRLLAVSLLPVAACGSPAPDKADVSACTGLKHTVAQLPNGTVGSAGTQDEVALMGWQAIAHDARLRGDVQALEEAVLFANPAVGACSLAGYDVEDAAVKAIGQVCSGYGVNGIANGW